jgi:GT2 family glycosyltransferase
MNDLSIVIPTCQRSDLLERCLISIERGTQCSYEIIVVDGASTDGTAAVLNRARQRLGDRLQIIREEKREGYTKGINKGFRAAAGRFISWLNDDARPSPGSLDQALQQLSASSAQVGLVALFHAWQGIRNVAYESRVNGRLYRLLHVRGTLYANFGLGRRETFGNLGYFDESYFVFGADPDFSLKVWHAGMRVEPAYLTSIDHDEHLDARRDQDAARAKIDNERLFAKWNLPQRNTMRNDFDPAHPCTLQGRRDQPAMAG